MSRREASSRWTPTSSLNSAISAPTRCAWRAAMRRPTRTALRECHVDLVNCVSSGRLPWLESSHGVVVRGSTGAAGKDQPGCYRFVAAPGTGTSDFGCFGGGCRAGRARYLAFWHGTDFGGSVPDFVRHIQARTQAPSPVGGDACWISRSDAVVFPDGLSPRCGTHASSVCPGEFSPGDGDRTHASSALCECHAGADEHSHAIVGASWIAHARVPAGNSFAGARRVLQTGSRRAPAGLVQS